MVGRRVMAKVIIFKGNKLIEREIKLDSPFPLGDLLDKIDVSREEVGLQFVNQILSPWMIW